MILDLKEVLVDDFQSLPSFQIQEFLAFRQEKRWREGRKKQRDRDAEREKQFILASYVLIMFQWTKAKMFSSSLLLQINNKKQYFYLYSSSDNLDTSLSKTWNLLQMNKWLLPFSSTKECTESFVAEEVNKTYFHASTINGSNGL